MEPPTIMEALDYIRKDYPIEIVGGKINWVVKIYAFGHDIWGIEPKFEDAVLSAISQFIDIRDKI